MDVPPLPAPLLEKLCPAALEGGEDREEWAISIYFKGSRAGGYTARWRDHRPDLWPLLVFDGEGKLRGRIFESDKEADRKIGTELLNALSGDFPDRRDYVLNRATRRLVALLTPAAGIVRSGPPLEDRPARDFAQRYPHPVMGEFGPSPVKGLSFFKVYDESQMAEDPLIPALWVRTPDGRMLETDRDGYRRALSSVGWSPASDQEALAFGRFYATAESGLRHLRVVGGNDGPVELGIKTAVDLKKIGAAPPAVEKSEAWICRPRGDGGIDRLRVPIWIVRLCVADVQPKAWGLPGHETIYRLTVTVGDGVFDAAQETLWGGDEIKRSTTK